MTRKTKADGARPAWRRWSEADARAALDELAKTKETAVGFARRKGVSTQRLQYWRKRVSVSPTAGAPAFVAVTIPTAPVRRPEVEIHVGDIRIVVPEACDVEQVACLVAALSRRSRTC
jgi:hypothetical protein